MNRDKFDFDKGAKLGLNKRVQKKYQDKDSVSDISCVHSIEEAIKVFRNIVDHKLESCVQVEERGLFRDHVPGKAVDYNAVGTLVVREWDNRPGFTVHLAGPKMLANKLNKNILKSPLLNSYVCNKEKMLMIPNQGPLFQDPNDPFSFKVEVIEELAEFFLTCIPKKYKKNGLKESVTTLGLGNKVQKKHQKSDSVDNISCVHSPKEAVEMFRLLVDDKLEKKNRGFTIKENNFIPEVGIGVWKVSYTTPMIAVYLVAREWDEMPGFTLHFSGLYELTPLVKGNPLTNRYIINKKEVEMNTQFPILQDPEDPNIFKISVLEEIASMFLESIIELDKKTVNESSQTSLGMSKKVQKIHDTRDAVSEVDPLLDFNSFFNVLKDFLKNKIKEHEDTRINDLFEELSKQKYAADNKDMIEIKLKLGFDSDSERITVNLYFDENSNFIKNVWSFTSFLGEPCGWDLEEKFSSEFLTDRIAPLVKRGLILTASSASALADAIIEQALAYLDAYDEMTVSSSIQESALGLNSKVSNKFKSEHTASKEIDEMSKMGIDEFESYFTEMCSSLSFPEFKELRIKIDRSQLGVFILKYASTTGPDKKQKRFNGKLEWCVDEDTGVVFFYFWIDNNLYSDDDGYVSMKFGSSKKYVEKFFLPTYKNLKDCISFIEDFVNKNIKTIKKTFVDDTSLDESMSLGLSKKVQNKHEGSKEDAIENISILDPESFFDKAVDIIQKMLPDYALGNNFVDKFYINDPYGIRQGQFVKCRIANFFKNSAIAFALVIDLDNNKFILWKYNFKVAPYHENKTSIKKKILSPGAKELNISELRDELTSLVGTIDESMSSLGLASKAKKIHSEKDSVTALSELDEGVFLDMIADVVADQVSKLNDEVQKYPELVNINMSFKSCVFETPKENGNVKVYCCYSRRDGSQAKILASNLLILDLENCYDRKPKFVTYVSGKVYKHIPFGTVYYSESSTNHKTEDDTDSLIQNSLTITNVDRFGDFLYREIKARIEGGYY